MDPNIPSSHNRQVIEEEKKDSEEDNYRTKIFNERYEISEDNNNEEFNHPGTFYI